MSVLISLFLIGISLSMDTFSVCLSLGTFNISKRNMIIFPLIVGVFHFFMPLLGMLLGHKIITYLSISSNILLSIILLFISIQMFIEYFKKDEKCFHLSLLNMLLLALSVSLDSFSTGFGLMAITNNYILASTVFCCCAAGFTFIGLVIGKYSTSKLGSYSNLLGIILLVILSIFYFFK